MVKGREFQRTEDAGFCYVQWQASEPVFAAEAKRIRLIRAIGASAGRLGCRLSAFSILDDSMHLLLYTDRQRDVQDLRMSAILRETSRDGWPEAAQHALLKDGDSGWNIHGSRQAERFCCDIHLLPWRKGYVRDVNDYWFSS